MGKRVEPVPAADAFFLHVESPAAPQQVGGLVVLDAAPRLDALVELVRSRLDRLPRFRQRLHRGSPWRRPVWVGAGDVDWDWHVMQRPGPLHRLVSDLQAERLPRDRPLWRLVLVPDAAAVVLVVHHVVADGLGVVRMALRLLDPDRQPAPPAMRRPANTRLGVAVGLAQLATDGWARQRLPTSGTPRRRFGTAGVPLPVLRSAADRHGGRVTEVLLSALAGGLSRLRPGLSGPLRVLVPVTVRHQSSPAEGNLTAGAMVDLQLGPMPEPERLALAIRGCRRLRGGHRLVASRFLMQSAAQLLPPPVHAAAARTAYSGRFVQAILTNLPGPTVPYRLAGARVHAAYPIVPLAPGTSLAVGALGWGEELHFGVSTDPALLDDGDALAAAIREAVVELAG